MKFTTTVVGTTAAVMGGRYMVALSVKHREAAAVSADCPKNLWLREPRFFGRLGVRQATVMRPPAFARAASKRAWASAQLTTFHQALT
ncbi:MAG: hypothetical protein QOH84_5991 [Kribbellaceae bacterium]|nr:hypothetical protein [Kribbellaceae bacterium]